MLLGFTFMVISMNLCRNSNIAQADKIFRKLQLFSAAIYSLGHGMNDAQKTMGIIAMALFSKGLLGDTFHIPLWVVISCYSMISLGTMFGGWRIVKTMGTKITKLQPIGGFSAETAAACSIIGATVAGIPVSTTHTIAGAIVGVGASKRLTAVRWGVAGNIIWAWILTIPAAAAISAVIYFLADCLTA
jgi:PiT family inorganic phosphate transporter